MTLRFVCFNLHERAANKWKFVYMCLVELDLDEKRILAELKTSSSKQSLFLSLFSLIIYLYMYLCEYNSE
jgi:hypothetical protein